MIRDQELTISDEELFTSSAYQKYLTSMAKAATGRYRQGLQALMEWDARADAGIAHTDNYKIHINAANEITQSFPSRYLRSESLVGFNGHETAHLLFSDFTALGLYLGSMEKGAFYPSNPSFTELSYQTNCEEILEAMDSKDIHYGNAHTGVHVTINRIAYVPDSLKQSYQTVAPMLIRASKRLQKSIAPLLKEESEGGKLKNLQFGKRLDTRAMHHEDGTFFTRTRLPSEEQKLAVGLLVDESGSMSWGDRITHAKKTAIVLYDFCQSLQVPITIYGHSTGGRGVELYSYAEFDSIDTSDRYRLMDMSARGGNRDGAALRFVAEHLAKRREKQKLLIIISDGQPADTGYYGTEAEADLRGIKKEYSKKGIKLFAAAIGDDKENIKRIYQDGFLDITKLEDLPKNMTLLVKQYLK